MASITFSTHDKFVTFQSAADMLSCDARDENDVARRDSLYGLIRNVERAWRDAIDKIPASQSQYPLRLALPPGDVEIARVVLDYCLDNEEEGIAADDIEIRQ